MARWEGRGRGRGSKRGKQITLISVVERTNERTRCLEGQLQHTFWRRRQGRGRRPSDNSLTRRLLPPLPGRTNRFRVSNEPSSVPSAPFSASGRHFRFPRRSKRHEGPNDNCRPLHDGAGCRTRPARPPTLSWPTFFRINVTKRGHFAQRGMNNFLLARHFVSNHLHFLPPSSGIHFILSDALCCVVRRRIFDKRSLC